MEKELEIFNNFINNYDLSIPQLEEKKFHTFRVVDYAKEIAKSINMSDEDVKEAAICALFHDLGRFPQFSEYHTFHDRDSFDHGDKSYEILKEMGYDDNIVLNAVKYHNKYAIADDLSDREKLFAKITRDADKIDILLTQSKEKYEENYKITDEIMYYFNKKMLMPNNIGNYKTISRLREIAFIFDINYNKSYEIIKNSNIIDEKINTIYNATHDDKIFEIKKLLDERIDEHVR